MSCKAFINLISIIYIILQINFTGTTTKIFQVFESIIKRITNNTSASSITKLLIIDFCSD